MLPGTALAVNGRPTSRQELIQEVNEKPQELKWLPFTTSPSDLCGLAWAFSLIGLFISNLRNSGGQEFSESSACDGHMKDHRRPVLTLKCCRSFATVLSSMWWLVKPKRTTHWCVPKRRRLRSTPSGKSRVWVHPERQGRSGRGCGTCLGFPLGVIVANGSYPLLVLKCVILSRIQSVPSQTLPSVRSPLPWVESGQPADPGRKPLSSASFSLIISAAETRCTSWKNKQTKNNQQCPASFCLAEKIGRLCAWLSFLKIEERGNWGSCAFKCLSKATPPDSPCLTFPVCHTVSYLFTAPEGKGCLPLPHDWAHQTGMLRRCMLSQGPERMLTMRGSGQWLALAFLTLAWHNVRKQVWKMVFLELLLTKYAGTVKTAGMSYVGQCSKCRERRFFLLLE